MIELVTTHTIEFRLGEDTWELDYQVPPLSIVFELEKLIESETGRIFRFLKDLPEELKNKLFELLRTSQDRSKVGELLASLPEKLPADELIKIAQLTEKQLDPNAVRIADMIAPFVRSLRGISAGGRAITTIAELREVIDVYACQCLQTVAADVIERTHGNAFTTKKNES